MALLTRDSILAAAAGKTRDVEVPEIGGSVRLRMLSGIERDALFSSLSSPDGKTDMRRYRLALVAGCAIDEAGAAVLTLDDAARLDDGCAPGLARLFRAAQELNGLLPDAVGAAEGN
jgi:hypothetical protein